MSKSNLLNAPLNIEEIDGSPSLWPWKLLVSNNTLTDNGDGTATLITGSLADLDTTGFGENEVLFINGAAVNSNSNFLYDEDLGTPLFSVLNSDLTFDGAVTINDSGADKDFRVEGVGEANALFVQGSDGYVGIHTSTPQAPLGLPDNAAIGFGNVGDVLIDYDSGNASLDIDLTGIANTNLRIISSGDADLFVIDGTNGVIGVGNSTDSTIKFKITGADGISGLRVTATDTIGTSISAGTFVVNAGGSSQYRGFINQINVIGNTVTSTGGRSDIAFSSTDVTNTTVFATLSEMRMVTAGSNSSDHTVINGKGLHFISNSNGTGTVNFTNSYSHIYIEAFTADFTCDADVIGLYIEKQVGGTTGHKEIFLETTGGVYFRDSAINISSLAAGYLDVNADKVIRLNSGINKEMRNETNDYTLTDGDYGVVVDGVSNTVDITLPASPENGREFKIACKNADNAVTLLRNGKLILGDSNDLIMAEGDVFIFQYDSTSGSWW